MRTQAESLGARVLLRSIGVLVAFSAWNSAALAQSTARDTYVLEWTREPGAESCVSSLVLSRMLEETVGPVLRQSSEASLRIEAVVRRAEPPARWQARIKVTDPDGTVVGEREIAEDAPQCSAITPPLLLVLAFIIDPAAAERGLPEQVKAELSQSEAGSAPPPSKRAEPGERSKLRPDGERSMRDAQADSPSFDRGEHAYRTDPAAYVTLALALGAEIVPHAAPGFTAGFRWAAWEKWALGLSGAFWLPATVPVGGYRALDHGVEFNAAHTSATLCRRLFGGRRWATDGCAGAILGVRSTEALALAQRSRVDRAYFGPLVETEARFYLSRSWFLSGQFTVALSARRDRFVYAAYEGGEKLLFAPGMLFGWASAGLGANL